MCKLAARMIKQEFSAIFGSCNTSKFFLAPVCFYFILFVVLTWPAITSFSDSLFADRGDGFQCLWNLWWFSYAIKTLHTNPFFTTYLFYPVGTPLIAHTFHPFNGVIAVLLDNVFSLGQIYNAIVVFSYVFGGWAAFSLSYYCSRSFLGSLCGGFIFAFSSFHFAHTISHLQLVSLEWLPVYALMLLRLCKSPSAPAGASAAISLFLVSLCDYYYCFYSLLLTIILVAMESIRRRTLIVLLPEARTAWLTFVICSCLTTGVIVGALALTALRDHLAFGAHDTSAYSMDLFEPFIPQRFPKLTYAYWSLCKGSLDEHRVFLGYAVCAMVAIIAVRFRHLNNEVAHIWLFVAAVFAVLALGPHLTVWFTDTKLLTPYWMLLQVAPILHISGAPVRMMVMVTLACGVLFSIGVAYLQGIIPPKRKTFCFIILGAVLLFEYLPDPLRISSLEVPAYNVKLRGLPQTGSVLDATCTVTESMYYQTVHHKPLLGGYVSRFTQKTYTFVEWCGLHDLKVLSKNAGLAYFVGKAPLPDSYNGDFRQVFAGDNIFIYSGLATHIDNAKIGVSK